MKKFLKTIIILALIGACVFFAYKAGYLNMIWDAIVDYGQSVNPSTITKEAYEEYLKDGEKMEFTLSEDGTYYTLTGNGENKNPIKAIPAEYNGLPVKAIGYQAINYFDGASIIIIPEGVEEIADYAFNTSYGMARIFIPSTVTRVGDTICAQSSATFCIANGTNMNAWSIRWNFYKCPIEYRDFVPQ